jgi:hypothetical protein
MRVEAGERCGLRLYTPVAIDACCLSLYKKKVPPDQGMPVSTMALVNVHIVTLVLVQTDGGTDCIYILSACL